MLFTMTRGSECFCTLIFFSSSFFAFQTSMIQSIERYIRESLVSRSLPALSSAALVSSMHLLKACPDIVGRWASDIQQVALSSDK